VCQYSQYSSLPEIQLMMLFSYISLDFPSLV
jgi:hypothetical protein